MNLQVVLERETDGVADRRRPDRDLDLLEALRRREPMAAERLVTRYGDRAYRLASGITGNGQDAEEVVQDAFWTVVRKIDTFRGESAFGSWLYRIVANAAYQKLRGRQSRRHDLSLDEVLPSFDESGRHVAPMADWTQPVDNPALQAELRTVLTSAIDAFVPAQSETGIPRYRTHDPCRHAAHDTIVDDALYRKQNHRDSHRSRVIRGHRRRASQNPQSDQHAMSLALQWSRPE